MERRLAYLLISHSAKPSRTLRLHTTLLIVAYPGGTGAGLPASLDTSVSGHEVQHRFVSYELTAVVEMLEALAHPGREFIIKHLLPPSGAAET